MLVLLLLSRASDLIDTTLGLGGSVLALTVLILPVVTALAAAAYVWLARQLEPEVPWIPGLIPLGAWAAAFVGIVLATS